MSALLVKKKKTQFCITSYVINTKTAEHSAKNCTRHSFSRVCKSLGLILRLRLSYLHHLAEDASSTKSYRKLEKEQQSEIQDYGKFLPSPGLQGHQADLVVPTNKNNTHQRKMLISFKLSIMVMEGAELKSENEDREDVPAELPRFRSL